MGFVWVGVNVQVQEGYCHKYALLATDWFAVLFFNKSYESYLTNQFSCLNIKHEKQESLQFAFKSLLKCRPVNVNKKLFPWGGSCLGKGSIPKGF